jgi:hypothetical protein
MTYKEKDQKTAILNIEFSQTGDMLAVSFDNTKSGNKEQGEMEKEGSYITVFSSKSNQKFGKLANDQNIYMKILDIRCPSVYESYKTDVNSYGCAVYYMTFSQEEGSYLLIYY